MVAPDYAGWFALFILVGAQFMPYTSKLYVWVRYFFQRHLFFPCLPSHQEDSIIDILMARACRDQHISLEVEKVHDLLKGGFKDAPHVLNLISLRREQELVEREFIQLLSKGSLVCAECTSQELEQLRFHLYSCYRLLARIILIGYWGGRDRRRAFRKMGYNINVGDGDIYAKARRLRFGLAQGWGVMDKAKQGFASRFKAPQ